MGQDGEPRCVVGGSIVSSDAMAWHIDLDMNESTASSGANARITPRLIDSLYTEAMVLADEARAYFDDAGRDERQLLDPFARVGSSTPGRHRKICRCSSKPSACSTRMCRRRSRSKLAC